MSGWTCSSPRREKEKFCVYRVHHVRATSEECAWGRGPPHLTHIWLVVSSCWCSPTDVLPSSSQLLLLQVQGGKRFMQTPCMQLWKQKTRHPDITQTDAFLLAGFSHDPVTAVMLQLLSSELCYHFSILPPPLRGLPSLPGAACSRCHSKAGSSVGCKEDTVRLLFIAALKWNVHFFRQDTAH